MIVIIDFGSQTTHLIGRRVRGLGVEVKIVEPDKALGLIRRVKPQGIILSGGPASVYEKGSPVVSKAVFGLGVPVLGICYGWQLMAKLLGGRVVAGRREYGPTKVRVIRQGEIFKGTKRNLKVWMSHGDEVVKLPKGFSYLASSQSVRAGAVGDQKKQMYGLQFHPEVEHTEMGTKILRNFFEAVGGLPIKVKRLRAQKLVDRVKKEMSGNEALAISAVSGGVDSTVASAIVARAIGKRFIPVHVDNGLMRLGTAGEVEEIFKSTSGVKPIIVKARSRFLKALKGVVDPEKKRKVIGRLYIKIFEEVARRYSGVKYLVQGTIYSDVIESQGSKLSSKIKSHHNVGGLPEKMDLKLLEPLREFYKDEVRKLGRQLGLDSEVVDKQPFPGPGQAIRIMGEVTRERLVNQQLADQIVIRVLKETGWFSKVFQSFPIMTGVKSTAVKGDGRVYGEVVGLRVYDSSDIMTAGWTRLPYEVLQQIATQIVNRVPGVSRVVYDITTKPPATMEWE